MGGLGGRDISYHKSLLLYRAKERLDLHRAELELPIPHRKKIRHEWYTQLKVKHTNNELG